MIYKLDYVSGTQTKVYVGTQYIDDIFHLQFGYNEEKGLAYGYGSQQYNAVIRGRQLVTGSFGMNFKTKQQLFAVLRKELSMKYQAKVAIDGNQRERIISFQDEPSTSKKIDQVSNLDDKAFNELASGVIGRDTGFNPNKGDQPPRPIRHSFDFPPFDIIVEFGNIDAELYGHTRLLIHDCFLTNETYSVEVVGKPVSQMVRFRGKGIV